MGQFFIYTFITIVAIIILFVGILFITYFGVWVRSASAGVSVSPLAMFLMRLRRVNPGQIVDAKIRLVKAGEHVSINDLEAHVLSGGNIGAVVDSLISANKADLSVDFKKLSALDLAGRDVRRAVHSRVHPIVINCPSSTSGSDVILAVSKDGIKIGVRVKITVRTFLDKLIGGAGEETVAARVWEGVVAIVGKTASHQELLENPDIISRALINSGLDNNTSLEVISVDVGDIDVYENIRATLRSAQADADRRIAEAQAEERRALAVAQQQEMKARIIEMQSVVLSAKSIEPLALSSAYKENNMGSNRYVKSVINDRLKWK